MNEIQLSNNLQQIELEINHHKNIAGQSIWEIGRRLNHVKENDLAHGEFISWVESIGFNRYEATRFIKVANELPNVGTLAHLGLTALNLIATLPEEERTKEHATSKGEMKKPDEMTVRELQELKRQLKAKDDQIEMQAQMIEDLNEQEPQVIEKEVVVEKIPSDYESLKSKNERLQSEMRSVKNSLELQKTKYSLLEQSTTEAKLLKENIDSLRKQEDSLTGTVKAIAEFNEMIKEINHLFDEKMASLRFKPLIDTLYDTEAPNRLRETVDTVDFWVEEMRKILPNKNMKIIEGEIINE